MPYLQKKDEELPWYTGDHVFFALVRNGAPKVLILAVLLLLWSPNVGTLCQAYDFAEFFAGKASCSKAMFAAGYGTASLDILYHNPVPDKENPMDILTASGMALALATILNCKPGAFVTLLGVVCSSWTAVNQGTSRRHITHPLGSQNYDYVHAANVMVSRVVLLIWLIESLGGVWCLEQPSSSLLRWHPRMLELFQKFQVYSARWWMASYGARTPKRHVMYSNSKDISWFNLGKLRFDYSDPEYQKNRTTKVVVKQLEGGKTKKSFQGVKGKLKESQHYPPRFGQKFLRLFPKFIKSCTPLEEALPQVADQDVYAGMSFKDMWEDADMESVIRYLKGNRCLLIPAEYRSVLLQSDHD